MATIECLGGHTLLLDEQLNQWLHGLHFLVRNEAVIFGYRHKVHKTHVQDIVLVDVPEGVEPVGVV